MHTLYKAVIMSNHAHPIAVASHKPRDDQHANDRPGPGGETRFTSLIMILLKG